MRIVRNIITKRNFKEKVFCISFQRTGTTSVGQFFKDHDYKVATWDISNKNKWPLKWLKGDFETIFRSYDFNTHTVFEDAPWWYTDFYKVLFHRYPGSKFILLERDPNMWFNSMVSHSGGKTLGNTHRHAVLYRRLEEYYKLKPEKDNRFTNKIDNLLPLGEEHKEHYTKIYKEQNREVKTFFEISDSSRLFQATLEDKELWQKMGRFFKINVAQDYSIHVNKSKKL